MLIKSLDYVLSLSQNNFSFLVSALLSINVKLFRSFT